MQKFCILAVFSFLAYAQTINASRFQIKVTGLENLPGVISITTNQTDPQNSFDVNQTSSAVNVWSLNFIDSNYSVQSVPAVPNILFVKIGGIFTPNSFSAKMNFCASGQSPFTVYFYNKTSIKTNSISTRKVGGTTLYIEAQPQVNSMNPLAMNLMQLFNQLIGNKSQCICSIEYILKFSGQMSSTTFNIEKIISTPIQTSSLLSLPPVRYYRNDYLDQTQCLDFSQFFFNATSNLLESQFKFNRLNFHLKSTHLITLQYANGVWPKVDYQQLPVQVSPTLALKPDYSLLGIKKGLLACFCIRITLFNGSNSQIVMNNSLNTVKIVVCPWWSLNLSNITSNTSIQLQEKSQYYYFKNNSDHNFYLKSNLTNGSNLEIFEYPRSLQSTIINLIGLKIIKIQAGWFFYSSNSIKTWISVNFSLRDSQKTYREEKYEQYYKQIGGDITASTLGGVISIPTIGMLLKLTPFITLIDDFSYLVYHGRNAYDTGIGFISEFCWNLTHSKWQPPPTLMDKLTINLSSNNSSSDKWIVDIRKKALPRLYYKNQDLFFLNNCKGYLFYTIPFSTLIFLVFWKMYWKFNHIKIFSYLTSFSSWSFLGVSIIGDNIRFLSFHGFSQILFLAPQGVLQNVSVILALTVIFIVVMACVCLYTLSWQWANNKFYSLLIIRRLEAYQVLSLWIGMKCLQGFIHVFIDDSIQRVSMFLFLQICMLVSLLYSRIKGYQRCKAPCFAMTVGYIFRSVLHAVMLIQAIFKERLKFNKVNIIDTALSELVFLLFGLILICNFFEVLSGIISNTLNKGSETVSQIQSQMKVKKEQKDIVVNRPLKETLTVHKPRPVDCERSKTRKQMIQNKLTKMPNHKKQIQVQHIPGIENTMIDKKTQEEKLFRTKNKFTTSKTIKRCRA